MLPTQSNSSFNLRPCWPSTDVDVSLFLAVFGCNQLLRETSSSSATYCCHRVQLVAHCGAEWLHPGRVAAHGCLKNTVNECLKPLLPSLHTPLLNSAPFILSFLLSLCYFYPQASPQAWPVVRASK